MRVALAVSLVLFGCHADPDASTAPTALPTAPPRAPARLHFAPPLPSTGPARSPRPTVPPSPVELLAARTYDAVVEGPIAVGDFDGDGQGDVAFPSADETHPSTYGFAVAWGLGHADLSTPQFSRVAGSLWRFVAADVDGDGRADLVSAGYDGIPSIHWAGPNRTFRTVVVDSSVDGQPFRRHFSPSIAAADVDGDGQVDLAVTTGGTVVLLRGLGNETFAPAILLLDEPAGIATPLVTGDFDGDGRTDLAFAVLTDRGPGQLRAVMSDGNGSFHTATTWLDLVPDRLVAGDWNGDGVSDLAAGFSDDDLRNSLSELDVVVGNGDGTFRASFSTGISCPATSLAAGDVDRDGHVDLLVGVELHNQRSGVVEWRRTDILRGRGDGTFDLPTPIELSSAPDALAISDLDDDGNPDLIASDSRWLNVSRGRGGGAFTAAHISSPLPSWVWGLAAADFDGDGRDELVAAGPHYLQRLSRSSDQSLRAVQAFDLGMDTFARGAVIADFDHDSRLDVAVLVNSYTQANTDTNEVLVFRGQADGSLGPPRSSASPIYLTGALVAGDFNGDGNLDLFGSAGWSSNDAGVLPGLGDGRFGALIATSAECLSAVAVDFDGDGRLDVLCSPPYKPVRVLIGDGTGHFAAPVPLTLPAHQYDIAVADLDGDGRRDLVFNSVSFEASVLLVMRGLPHGGFGHAMRATVVGSTNFWGQVVPADFNRDGIIDLAVGGVTALVGRGGLRFDAGPAQFATPGGAAAVADLDGDGWPDLAYSGSSVFGAIDVVMNVGFYRGKNR